MVPPTGSVPISRKSPSTSVAGTFTSRGASGMWPIPGRLRKCLRLQCGVTFRLPLLQEGSFVGAPVSMASLSTLSPLISKTFSVEETPSGGIPFMLLPGEPTLPSRPTTAIRFITVEWSFLRACVSSSLVDFISTTDGSSVPLIGILIIGIVFPMIVDIMLTKV